MGRYEVRFNGSPATQAVTTAIVPSANADMVSVTNEPGPGPVHGLRPRPAARAGAFVDDSFSLITP
jgi:hypothetical protein